MNEFGEVVLAKWTNLTKWVFLVKLFWPNERIWRSGFGQIDEFGEMGVFGETILAKWTNLAKWVFLVKLFWPNE